MARSNNESFNPYLFNTAMQTDGVVTATGKALSGVYNHINKDYQTKRQNSILNEQAKQAQTATNQGELDYYEAFNKLDDKLKMFREAGKQAEIKTKQDDFNLFMDGKWRDPLEGTKIGQILANTKNINANTAATNLNTRRNQYEFDVTKQADKQSGDMLQRGEHLTNGNFLNSSRGFIDSNKDGYQRQTAYAGATRNYINSIPKVDNSRRMSVDMSVNVAKQIADDRARMMSIIDVLKSFNSTSQGLPGRSAGFSQYFSNVASSNMAKDNILKEVLINALVNMGDQRGSLHAKKSAEGRVQTYFASQEARLNGLRSVANEIANYAESRVKLLRGTGEQDRVKEAEDYAKEARSFANYVNNWSGKDYFDFSFDGGSLINKKEDSLYNSYPGGKNDPNKTESYDEHGRLISNVTKALDIMNALGLNRNGYA